MRAMILAAGRGERMRPLTDTCPKPLLKIGDMSLIEYHIKALKKAGIKDIVINHAWLGEMIEKSLGNGQQYGVNISYSPEKEALETAGGIVQALPQLTQDEDSHGSNSYEQFLVVNGDIFCDIDFSILLKKQIVQLVTSNVHIILVPNPEHNPEGDFYLEENTLNHYALNKINTQDKNQHYTYSGIGIYRAEFFKQLEPGRRALAPLLKQAMQKNKVTGELYNGRWTDVGTPERLKTLQEKAFF